MRVLGLLLLAFGILACVDHFMAMDWSFMNWVETWGEGVAWAIRGGSVVLGLWMTLAGKKKKK
jgi:hypothetical protein